MNKPIPIPSCYGLYRSGQSDAENCCEDCPYDNPCMATVRAIANVRHVKPQVARD